MALRPRTISSRRARNSSTMAAGPSCGPVSASTPASCVKAAVQLLLLVISRVMGCASSGGTIPYPRRHPVMA